MPAHQSETEAVEATVSALRPLPFQSTMIPHSSPTEVQLWENFFNLPLNLQSAQEKYRAKTIRLFSELRPLNANLGKFALKLGIWFI